MSTDKPPFERLGIRALFLVWGAPLGSHRSELIGKQLGVDVRHIYITSRKGRYIALVKYFFQAIMTFVVLLRHRYQLVFVQDPPIFAALPVYFYSLFARTRFVIDSHTDALQAPLWEWTLPLHRFLEGRAITTIVTNDCLREKIESWGRHGFTLPDPPAQFDIGKPVDLLPSTLDVVVVSSAAYDEPIEEILQSARALPDVAFYVTGDYSRSPRHLAITEWAPSNVHFTGYQPDNYYYSLLDAADVIICLSSEDNTFLSGANEALWLGKPLITSDWPLLREYFSKGAIHVDNTADSIRRAVVAMRGRLPVFQAEIRTLQDIRRQNWWEKANSLIQMIQEAM